MSELWLSSTKPFKNPVALFLTEWTLNVLYSFEKPPNCIILLMNASVTKGEVDFSTF